MIPGSNVSRALARTGVEWVLVDCEHGNIDGEYYCKIDTIRQIFLLVKRLNSLLSDRFYQYKKKV